MNSQPEKALGLRRRMHFTPTQPSFCAISSTKVDGFLWLRIHSPRLLQEVYSYLGEKGTYTRKRGLDKETNKQLLLRHIGSCHHEGGSPLGDLTGVLPGLGEKAVEVLLQELRIEEKIHFEGTKKLGRWFVGPAPISSASPHPAPQTEQKISTQKGVELSLFGDEESS